MGLASATPMVDDALAAVEARMRTLAGDDAILSGALLTHLGAGGRRVRARLAVSAGIALGVCEPARLAIATACELLHNASLVHDDIQDRQETRRGQASVWATHGANVAVCAGDQFLSAAYCALAEAGGRVGDLVALTHHRVSDVIAGQTQDIAARGDRSVTLERYLTIAGAKSGPLLSLPLELTLMAAGREGDGALARDAARAFALTYQMTDDLADIDEDRAAGNALNVVLVLENMGRAPGAAIAEASTIAQTYADDAVRLANALPQGMGDVLRDYAMVLASKAAAAA